MLRSWWLDASPSASTPPSASTRRPFVCGCFLAPTAASQRHRHPGVLWRAAGLPACCAYARDLCGLSPSASSTASSTTAILRTAPTLRQRLRVLVLGYLDIGTRAIVCMSHSSVSSPVVASALRVTTAGGCQFICCFSSLTVCGAPATTAGGYWSTIGRMRYCRSRILSRTLMYLGLPYVSGEDSCPPSLVPLYIPA